MQSFENKTILITGATGLIGSHLVEKLMQIKDTKVIALSRDLQKLKECFSKYLDNQNFSFVAQNVVDDFKFKDQSIDYIFHAAGPIEGKIIHDFPLSVIEPNIIGTKNCLEFLKNQESSKGIKGRLIVFSSETVYGRTETIERHVMEEDTELSDKLNSNNAPYSQGKRMAEVIANAYFRQYKIDSVVVRLSYVYGYTKFQPNTAFFEIINNALNGNNIIMNNNKFLKRDNIYVEDAVEGILKVCVKGISGQSYNVSSNGELGNYIAIDEIADIVVELVNKHQKNGVKIISKNGFKFEHNPGIIMNNLKLKNLGWDLKTSIKDGIRQVIKDIKSNADF